MSARSLKRIVKGTLALAVALLCAHAPGCSRSPHRPGDESNSIDSSGDDGLRGDTRCHDVCTAEGSSGCLGTSRITCTRVGQCLQFETQDCALGCTDGVCLKSLCGNSLVEEGEFCDSSVMSCATLEPWFNGGEATCAACQSYDESVCDRVTLPAFEILEPTACFIFSDFASVESVEMIAGVSDLTHISTIHIDVRPASDCGVISVAPPIAGYPLFVEPAAALIQSIDGLTPDRWHLLTIETVAAEGYLPGVTLRWFHTASQLTYEQEVAADTPLGYWRLGDPAGTDVFLDSSGNGHDGLFTLGYGAAPAFALGAAGAIADGDTAVTMSGGVGTVAYQYPQIVSDFTLEMWLRYIGTEFQYLAGRRVSSGNSAYLLNTIWSPQNGGVSLEVTSSDGAAASVNSGDVTYNDGQWHHIVGVKEGVALRLFVDGELVAEKPNSLTIADLRTTAANFEIGNYTINYPFLGDIDELALYDHALDASRIATHFEAAARQ